MDMIRKRYCLPVLFLIAFSFVLLFPSESQTYYDFDWWDNNWGFRIGLEINASKYDRYEWIVEYPINYTWLLQNVSSPGNFDINSTRVIEYTENGNVIREIPSQFDPEVDFNKTTNAAGTLTFIMNGTTPAFEKRYFFVYFDVEGDNKNQPSYPSEMTYYNTSDLEEFNVTNSKMEWYVDTMRSENTSGLYKVKGRQPPAYNDIFGNPGTNERTIEYLRYSNGTQNFSFDLRNNITWKHVGPLRIVAEQEGFETFWNDPDTKTGEGYITKRYTFYLNQSYVKIEQEYSNIGDHNITRGSGNCSGMNFDASRALGGGAYLNGGNTTDPGSWAYAAEEYASWDFGIINLNESVPNFYAENCNPTGKIGITLQDVKMTPGFSIDQVSIVRFNDTQGDVVFTENLSHRLMNNVQILRYEPEMRAVHLEGIAYYNQTEVSVFNRKDTFVLSANVTFDPHNLTRKINATLDMGTPGTGDDLVMVLFDDGTHGDMQAGDNVYSNNYTLSESSETGEWNTKISVYDDDWTFINETYFIFNVSDVYNVSANIHNEIGLINRTVNATVDVLNIRGDEYVAGAVLNCTYYGKEVSPQNMTDYGNGTYFVTFISPEYAGSYTLNCTASKYNNTGWDSEDFSCDNLWTTLNMTLSVHNYTYTKITWNENESFPIWVNVTNVENGSALNTNVTLTFSSQNITANVSNSSCGTVMVGKYCEKSFLITGLNGTVPGNYTVDVTVDWENFNGSIRSVYSGVNITVSPNVSMNVPEDNVSGMLGVGKPLKNIDNFTVYSWGNDQLDDVEFDISGFNPDFNFVFSPENISSLGTGGSQKILVYLNISASHPTGGFNGTLNVTSSNGGFKLLNVSVYITGTNMSINVSRDSYTADNVTWHDNETFPVHVFTENTGNSTAFGSNISFSFSSSGITANVTSKSCGDVGIGGNCSSWFLVIVKSGTLPGNYTVNVSSLWYDPDEGTLANTSVIEISVGSNKFYQVDESEVSENLTHGTVNVLGGFTLNNTGNDYIYNITYNYSNITGDFNVTFSEKNVSSLAPGEVRQIGINVTVPLGYLPGSHYGWINITSSDSYNFTRDLELIVTTSRTWTMDRAFCERILTPEMGTVCNVTINNTGNVPTNFTITPVTNPTSMYNYTWTGETSFGVLNLTSHMFTVNYNVTGTELEFFYSNYTIAGVQAESDPPNRTLEIVLNPFIKPGVEVGVMPNITEQLNTVYILANVTDHSGSGIVNVTANVSLSGNVSYLQEMRYCGEYYNNYHCYEIYFPADPFSGTWGDSSVSGFYNVSVSAVDSAGKNETVTKKLGYYKKLITDPITEQTHYRGETGTVMVSAHDVTGDPIGGARTNVNLFDPDGKNVTYFFWLGNSIVTDSGGNGGLLFLIPSGATLGTYSLFMNSSVNYSSFNTSNYNDTIHTFEVKRHRTVYGSVGVPDPSYIDKIMPVSVITLDQNGDPVDPDYFELMIYYTEGYSFQVWRNLTMASNFSKESTGFYSYSELLPSGSVLTGSYLALLKVGYDGRENYDLKAFRIVSGGPYDVKITSIEGEVTQSDFLDFQVLIENMGEVDHLDVKVEYWINDIDGNQTWDYGNSSVNIPAHSNRTFVDYLNIYSFQPLGQYVLNVLVTYDPALSPAPANRTFWVVESVPGPPPGPEAPGGGAAPSAGAPPSFMPSGEPEIEISGYPREVGVESGGTKYLSIEVENTGNVTVNNVSLAIRGIPSAWVEITPGVAGRLVSGNTTTFSVKLSVPVSAEAKEYMGTMIATAPNQTSDEKSFKTVVFLSKAKLVEWEINRLKTALQELESDTDDARDSGRDVSEVLPVIEELEDAIDEAEGYLGSKDYDNALQSVFIGWKLVDRIRYLISKAPMGFGAVTGFPLWMIIIIIILIVIIVAVLLMMKKMKGVTENLFRNQMSGVKPKTLMAERIEEKSSLEEDKAKINRVLNLLEKEKNEGLITEKAYNDLVTRNRNKLKSIEESIGKTK